MARGLCQQTPFLGSKIGKKFTTLPIFGHTLQCVDRFSVGVARLGQTSFSSCRSEATLLLVQAARDVIRTSGKFQHFAIEERTRAGQKEATDATLKLQSGEGA